MGFFKQDKKILQRFIFVLIEDIKKLEYIKSTEMYTIQVKTGEIYGFNFKDEDLDDVFDRVLNSKLKSLPDLTKKHSRIYNKLIFQIAIDKINSAKKEQLFIGENLQIHGPSKKILEIPALNIFSFIESDFTDTDYDRRLCLGTVTMFEGKISENQDDEIKKTPGTEREVVIALCNFKPLINFEHVLFSQVASIYQNRFSKIRLPEWMDFDQVYVFKSGIYSIDSNLNSQIPYYFIFPLQ